ncbi:MAG TPA: thrombospondin type 3 repeat-containing protein [Paludibacter sp.]
MKIKKPFLIALLISTQIISAQTADNRFALGLNFVKNEYNGDYGNGIFNFSQRWYAAGGISLSTYLTPSFDLGLQGTYGNYGYYKTTIDNFAGGKFDASLYTHYKLNNGYILREDSKWSPFLSLGFGVANYSINNSATPWPTIITDGPDLIIPLGVGLKYQLTSSIAIQYQYLYNFTTSDVHDQNRSGGVNNIVFGTPLHPGIKAGNDAYGQHMLGFVFTLSGAKDSDHDGVSDKYDKCIDTPVDVKVDAAGCPIDSDNDGVADYLDKCSDTPSGVKVDVNGCPVDADKDGIADYLDKCPAVAGLEKFNGCPDTDGDGIQDSEDKCPTVAGLAKLNGCPDTDGDGITDSEDKCPTVAGLAKFNGCPDTDGDGVPDNLDKCPTIAGIAANKGCPEVKAETKKIFAQALQGIQFESGKDVIKKTSFPILNKVVTVMKENPSYELEINGHTDSQGDDAKNMVLSQNRANAVKAYLVNQGVDAAKLTAKGFGETMPVANNATTQGRTLNRRVEFKVNF